MVDIKKVFLASSAELKADRDAFELLVNRRNQDWVPRGVFIDVRRWEFWLDAMSAQGLQEEYNKLIDTCDLFVMLFHTKVGPYTEQEFDRAFGQFKASGKPFIWTYFKDAPAPGPMDPKDQKSLKAFQAKLRALRHYQTTYTSTATLELHFTQQLDKLVANGFIAFNPEDAATADRYQATLSGDGAIAQGDGAMAAGAGGVVVGGKVPGSIRTGGTRKPRR